MTGPFSVVGAGTEFTAPVAEFVPQQGRLHLRPGRPALGRPGPLISPGWIDLHTHVYDGCTSLSVHPDVAGWGSGVSLVVDAGSAGEATVDGLFRYVAPAAETPLRAFVNIGSHGLVHLREVADLAWVDVDRTLEAISRHRPFVCGVKVRSSGAIVGSAGLQPLQLARIVAREAGLPLMVHIGEPPPPIEDVLGLLDDGDIVTHCFHGKTGGPWAPEGDPKPALRAALGRGVLLDVGHGRASFSATVARKAIAAGWRPNSISTDLHVRNISGPVHSLAVTMTKMMALGMSLEQVISAVTEGPAAVLREPSWLGEEGFVRRATIFRLEERDPAGPAYTDAHGTTIDTPVQIVPDAVVIDGRLFECKKRS